MEQEPEYLKAQQAASYLGVNRQRLYALVSEGRLGKQIGGYWLFTRAELDAYEQERSQRRKGGRPRKHVASDDTKEDGINKDQGSA